MTNQKQKEKKKKDREREVKVKILKKREAAREQRKIAISEEIQRQEIEELSNGKSKPIISDKEKLKEKEKLKFETISEQLKRNLEILEVLEQEYDKEQQNRINVNEKLESEGFISIKEKMDALHQKALEMTEKVELQTEFHT